MPLSHWARDAGVSCLNSRSSDSQVLNISCSLSLELLIADCLDPRGAQRYIRACCGHVRAVAPAPGAVAKYSEAPTLAALVKAGKLPPVEERLPENPLVEPVVEQIGTYGGVMRRAFTGPVDGANPMRMNHDSLLFFSMDGGEVVPQVAESWEVSDGGRVFTFKLRQGMRWSDGEPFSADDMMYWYENELLNKDLSPSGAGWMKPTASSDMGVLEKVDDFTVRFRFKDPYQVFPEVVAQRDVAGVRAPYAPAHYRKQFHSDFISDADMKKMLADESLDNFAQLYKLKVDYRKTVGPPIFGAWFPETSMSDQRFRMVRNPYYFRVDPEGNQLPYIDELVMDFAENIEVLNLRAISGELDFQGRHVLMTNFPILKESEDKGGYRVVLWPTFGGTDANLFFNQSYDPDAAVTKYLTDKTFRQALSLAIDRDQINDSVFLGLGQLRQAMPAPSSPYYPGDSCALRYTELDQARANQMLDDLGLDKKNADGFRVYPDSSPDAGKVLSIDLDTYSGFAPWPDVGELVVRDWARVGIKANINVLERTLFYARLDANERMVGIREMDTTGFLLTNTVETMPTNAGSSLGALYGLWYESGGEKGMKPPAEILEVIDLHERGRVSDRAGQIKIAKQIFEMHCDQLWIIGTAGLSPLVQGVVVVNKNLRNVPEFPAMANDWPLRTPGNSRPEQFFFAK